MSLRLLAELEIVAARAPESIALIEESGRVVSYEALVARIARIAVALRHHGVRRGDRVLFAIRPSETAVATIVALTEIGAVLIAAQVGVGDELFESQMRTVEPSWVIAESVLIAAMRHRLVRAILRRRGTVLPSITPLRNARVVTAGAWIPGLGGATRLEDIERRVVQHDTMRRNNAHGDLAPHDATIDSADAQAASDDVPAVADDALIVFTSGTTASPKAVVHTRATLASTLDAVSSHLPVQPGDRILARDLHLIVPALRAGATAFVPSSQEMPSASLLAAIEQHGITHLFEVTAHLERLLAHLEQVDRRFPDSVRQILVGAAPVRHAFFARLSQRIGADTQAWCVYGMTEMLPIAAIELREKLQFPGVGDVVGLPVRNTAVSVSEEGELIVAGPHLFNRYLGNTPVTEHATGDLAEIDRDGRIVLLGRSKDMIIRGAFNIYPALHEPLIEQIEGVHRAAMIGVFDEKRADERVVLIVEPAKAMHTHQQREEFARQVSAALRTTHRIDRVALPDDVVIAAIPLAGRSSKVDKAQLRQSLRELLHDGVS